MKKWKEVTFGCILKKIKTVKFQKKFIGRRRGIERKEILLKRK